MTSAFLSADAIPNRLVRGVGRTRPAIATIAPFPFLRRGAVPIRARASSWRPS